MSTPFHMAFAKKRYALNIRKIHRKQRLDCSSAPEVNGG